MNASAVFPLRVVGSPFRKVRTRIRTRSEVGMDASLERRPCCMSIARPVLSNGGGSSSIFGTRTCRRASSQNFCSAASRLARYVEVGVSPLMPASEVAADPSDVVSEGRYCSNETARPPWSLAVAIAKDATPGASRETFFLISCPCPISSASGLDLFFRFVPLSAPFRPMRRARATDRDSSETCARP